MMWFFLGILGVLTLIVVPLYGLAVQQGKLKKPGWYPGTKKPEPEKGKNGGDDKATKTQVDKQSSVQTRTALAVGLVLIILGIMFFIPYLWTIWYTNSKTLFWFGIGAIATSTILLSGKKKNLPIPVILLSLFAFGLFGEHSKMTEKEAMLPMGGISKLSAPKSKLSGREHTIPSKDSGKFLRVPIAADAKFCFTNTGAVQVYDVNGRHLGESSPDVNLPLGKLKSGYLLFQSTTSREEVLYMPLKC